MTTTGRTLVALAALIAVSCRGTESPGNTVRDSAGVRIVENRTPLWTDRDRWRIDTATSLEVGGGDLLARLGNTFRLDDGRIVVAHPGGHEILLYSSAGQLLRRVGRRGSGPGEFEDLSRVLRAARGDSIIVWDYNQNRLSVFDSDGDLVRGEAAVTDGTRLVVEDVFRDGSLLMASAIFPPRDGIGLVRPMRTLFRREPGGRVTPIVETPGMEMFVQPEPSGMLDVRPPLIGHTSSYTVANDRLVWATTDSFRLHVLSPDGRLLMVIAKDHEPQPVTAADVDPLIEEQVAALRDEAARPGRRRLLSSIPRGTFPAFGAPDAGPALLADDDGNLWVSEYARPGSDGNVRLVFDSTGAWLGSVELPSGFGPRHIGRDFVLGKRRDSLDVEHVLLYPLRRP